MSAPFLQPSTRPLSKPQPLHGSEPMDDDVAEGSSRSAAAGDVPGLADGLPDGSRLVRGDDGGMYLVRRSCFALS